MIGNFEIIYHKITDKKVKKIIIDILNNSLENPYGNYYKVPAIQAVRKIAPIGLKDAKELVERIRGTIDVKIIRELYTKYYKEILMNNKGFTVIEILVVIAICSVLVCIGFTFYACGHFISKFW
jgi:prepilin-type N-terminal cleavage/methylation domain-containing protein